MSDFALPPKNDLASRCARIISRHPAAIGGLLAMLVAASAWVVVGTSGFDSDVLNLLPSENPAVLGLKRYNEQFTQTRELAFLLQAGDADAAANAHEIFVEHLEKQPWARRVLGGSPALGGSTLEPHVMAALILNLPTEDIRKINALLDPASIAARIDDLARRASGGSPAALIALESDPLGIASPAIARVAGTVDIEASFELESPCGTAFVVPVVTDQPDASAESCRETMEKVRFFLGQTLPEFGPGVTIGVTGRSAYVEEIAASMEADLQLTSLVSGIAVLFIFWLGFRRLIPLAGIGIILFATALATLAGGMLGLGELNIIAISFCSILFGLGDDFSLLLCQRFYKARADGLLREAAIARSLREAMPGIFCVAVTTAIGFLALCLSGSSGMGQLGAMVALGVILCALLMPAFLFLFLGGKASAFPAATGPLEPLLHWFAMAPRPVNRFVLGAGLALGVMAIMPWKTLHFDLSPSSLEPRDTPAAIVLSEMLRLFPGTFEPVMVIVEDPDPHSLEALEASLRSLRQRGLASKLSIPSGLWLDPDRAEQNFRILGDWNFDEVLEALREAAERNRLNPRALAPAEDLLRHLAQPSTGSLDWTDLLPEESPWWFLVDRMIAPGGVAAIAYFQVPFEMSAQERLEVADELMTMVPGSVVTGWSQTLASLVPWARGELAAFGSAVVILILGILALVYRNARLWGVHVAALAFGFAGTVATLKLLDAKINLLNVLAFPLILAVGVDYGTHILLAAKERGRSLAALAGVVKAVGLSGLTTAAGFGALILARNPSLSGLGLICAVGVLWSLLSALFVVTPLSARLIQKNPDNPPPVSP